MATNAPAAKHQAGLFDIRNVIGLLLGLYGVILLLMGLFADKALDKTGGINANLWAGIVLLIVGIIFATWARLRPMLVPEGAHLTAGQDERGRDDEGDAGDGRGRRAGEEADGDEDGGRADQQTGHPDPADPVRRGRRTLCRGRHDEGRAGAWGGGAGRNKGAGGLLVQCRGRHASCFLTRAAQAARGPWAPLLLAVRDRTAAPGQELGAALRQRGTLPGAVSI
ncbi:hypothetical protein SDC9_101531 [bioreactor metagenome]|uniref:Uncharacterized protein n=1 Tax=bioreactor metagenome TaxID=1076179 RepID=A0A645AR05_9ZZZZ